MVKSTIYNESFLYKTPKTYLKMKTIHYLSIFIFLMHISNGLMINEIMYNPNEEDNNKEFIEIFSYPAINLSDYIVSDNDSNDTLILFYFNDNSNYSLIVEDEYLIKTNNASIYKIGATIGNGLSSDDIIYFYYPNMSLIDSVEINSLIANGNGYSMSYYNGSWIESLQVNGTPGYENSIKQERPQEETKNIILETYLDEIIYINTEYTQLFKIKIENKANCSEKDTVTVSYNITNTELIKQDEFTKEIGCSSYASTGEFIPTIHGNYTLCGAIVSSTINETDLSDNSACATFTVMDTSSIPCNITIDITTNETIIYEEGQSIKFKTLLNNETFPFTIEYWIEDFFGNIYKDPYNTTNTDQKSWKTNIAEQDRVLFIKSIVNPSCNDSNLLDNYAEKMFIVKSESNNFIDSSEESILEITEIDEKVKFGDVVDVKVNIYKGDTNKYSISLWIEDNGKKISETTKIHLYDKYSSYHGQLPIKLDLNCDEKLKDGKYDVVIEGLGKKDKMRVDIEGIKISECPTSPTETSSSSTTSKKFDFKVEEFNEIVNIGEKFKTKITFNNNNNEDINIKVWSYLYRGSKSYSGDREKNKKEFTLKANSLQIVELSNVVEEAEPGNYKFKVVVNKDNQKTNDEITKDITINENNIKTENIDIKTEKNNEIIETEIKKQSTNNALDGNIVYESTTEKAKSLVSIFIIILSVLLNIVLIWKR